MSRFQDPTNEQIAAWNEWVASRPESVRVVAERFDPWTLYRMRSTGHRVTLYSFGEAPDGSVTLTVNVTGEFNLVTFDRQVFGIAPDDLEECDLPSADESTGAALTPAEVEDNLDELRLQIRPDLWMRMSDGSVVMKGTN